MHHDSTIHIPLKSKKYPGMYAVVDSDDYHLVSGYSWYPMKRGGVFHAATKHGSQRNIYMHRLIADFDMVDHIDRDGLNNRRCNLRPATKSQNLMNTVSREGSVSQYKGVSKGRQPGRWRATIKVGSVQIALGQYSTEEDAARAYDVAAVTHFGEYARTNFPIESEQR